MKRLPSECGRLDPTRIAEPGPGDDPAVIFLPDNEGRWGKRRHGFEKIVPMGRERQRRAESLRANADRLPEDQRERALDLASRLETIRIHELMYSGGDPGTMREFRRRLGGEFHRFIRCENPDEAWLYYLASDKYRFPADELPECKPSSLLVRTCKQLERYGRSSHRQGRAALAYDNEYDPLTDTYLEHVHALVVGEMGEAFEALRSLSIYKSGDGSAIRYPIKRYKIVDPARQLTYLLKPFWQANDRQESGGSSCYGIREHRIPEPRHSEMLLALDTYGFDDFVKLIGLRFKNGRLHPTR